MDKYCITAANHKNPQNHVASSFQVWRLIIVKGNEMWDPLGAMTTKDVVELLGKGHEVITGKFDGESIESGAAIEVELRIVENKKTFPISEMPRFKP